MMSSIQSIPGVTATPMAAASAVPISAAAMPTSKVSQIGIFCLPGATSRPRAPMIRPTMRSVLRADRSWPPPRGSEPASPVTCPVLVEMAQLRMGAATHFVVTLRRLEWRARVLEGARCEGTGQAAVAFVLEGVLDQRRGLLGSDGVAGGGSAVDLLHRDHGRAGGAGYRVGGDRGD